VPNFKGPGFIGLPNKATTRSMGLPRLSLKSSVGNHFKSRLSSGAALLA